MLLFQKIIDSKPYYQPFWITLIILLAILIVGYIYYAYKARVLVIAESVLAPRLSLQLSREEHLLSNPVSILLSLNFLLCVSLFVCQVFSGNKMQANDFEFSIKWFFIVFVIIFLVYLIKIIGIKIIAFVFQKGQLADEYIFSLFSFNQITGIFFIPIVILNAYSVAIPFHILTYAGAGILIISYVARVGKGAVATFSSGELSLFYLFLYLCTFEVIPLLFVWKLINK